MAFFDFLKKNNADTNNKNYAKMLSGGIPIFSSFGNNVYASDVVQQAINCIIAEMKKLKPLHVIERGDVMEMPKNRVDIQTVLDNPNPLMTTSDFLSRIMWQLYLTYNAFIYPIWENGKLKALYPLKPRSVAFYEAAGNRLFIEFQFDDGSKSPVLEYEKIIHLRKNYSGANDFLGGDESGNPNYGALIKTLSLNDKLLQGVGKGMELSFAVQGILKTDTYMDEEKQAAALAQFNTWLQDNQNGVIPADLGGEFIPITRNIMFADNDLIKWLDEKILRHFGVPLPILTGDFTKQQKEAFYQKTIESEIVTVVQGFTKGIFTKEERRQGNTINLYYDKLQFFSAEELADFVEKVGGRGALTNNKILSLYGQRPYEGGDIRMASLNYINADYISEYQLKNKGGAKDEV